MFIQKLLPYHLSSIAYYLQKEGALAKRNIFDPIFNLPGECRLFNLHPLSPGLIATHGSKPFANAPP
jgi:hypothetical protein